MALLGCGGSSDDGASEVARQAELRAARQQAAQDARQSTRIAELEHKLRQVTKAKSDSTQPSTSQEPVSEATPDVAVSEESLVGLWKGEAVINYDNGESDPFQQTIQIESLTPGEAGPSDVSGSGIGA
jgi:hypothetical protein